MLRWIGNLFAIGWFIHAVLMAILLGIIVSILVAAGSIAIIRDGVVSMAPIGLTILIPLTFVFALTGWIPWFRKCYYKLPWLYPLHVMLVMNLLLLSVVELILYKGLSTMSTLHHVVTAIIAIAVFVLGRWWICRYLAKHPKVIHKYDRID